jgi:hypothetical protein
VVSRSWTFVGTGSGGNRSPAAVQPCSTNASLLSQLWCLQLASHQESTPLQNQLTSSCRNIKSKLYSIALALSVMGSLQLTVCNLTRSHRALDAEKAAAAEQTAQASPAPSPSPKSP